MIITYKSQGFCIQLNTQPEDMDYFVNELSPYFILEKNDRRLADICWLINMEIPECLERFEKIEEKKLLNEPCKIFYVDSISKEILIDQPNNSEWKKHIIIRIIRDLFRLHLIQNKGIPLHGGLIESGDGGIAILGSKKSGKTTTLLSLMEIDDKTSYVTNDDLIIQNCDNEIIGYGSTRSISVRKDTIPFFLTKVENIRIENPLNQTSLKNKYLIIRPKELFSYRIKSSSKVKLFIFPKFDTNVSKPRIEKLRKIDLLKKINKNIDDTTSKYFPMLFKKMYFYTNDYDSIQKNVQKILNCEIKGILVTQNINSMINFEDLAKEF